QLVVEANTVTGNLTLDAAKSQSDNGIKVELLDQLYDITLQNKSFEKGKWNAISLPFSANEQTLKSVFGEQYELKELAGIYSDGTTLYFATPANNAINPGMPYLIKPSKAVAANPVFNGVMLAYCPNWDNNHKPYGESVTFGDYTFSANLYLNSLKVDGTDLLIAGDAASFTTPQKANSWETTGPVYGLNAYIRKANGAVNPTISFVPEGEIEEQRTQKNDVPTIYIDTDATINADDWTTATIELFDQNNKIGGNKTWDNTAVSVKFVGDGNDIKTSYRLKFENKYALLGSKSGSYKQWVLESNDDDPTMLRNGLTEELGDQIGLSFTPGCQYADLIVNGTYVDTYQITDRVKVEGGRVLVSDKNNDWLLEIASNGEIGANDLYVAGDDTNPNIIIKNPDKDELTPEQQAALQTAVSTYFSTFWADIENQVDPTSFINWYVASEILGGYKQLSDIYVYKDNADGKLHFGPLWSNDKAYGNNPAHPVDMSDLSTAGSYNGLLFNHADYKVMSEKIRALWQEQWFKEAVINKWSTIYGDTKTTDLLDALTAKIDELAAEIAQTQADNYAPQSQGGAGWELQGDYTTAVQAIKDYLTQRFQYLDTKFKELTTEATQEQGDANNDGTVNITDVVILVNHILGSTDPSILTTCDLNSDGTINITDVVALVNKILGGTQQ
ncbi:MAG: CotH kinase family protein, partial [Bacteroidaceae bacterium]|nr:CotH kinase family protein [Bacteroidaceae bacterium]